MDMKRIFIRPIEPDRRVIGNLEIEKIVVAYSELVVLGAEGGAEPERLHTDGHRTHSLRRIRNPNLHMAEPEQMADACLLIHILNSTSLHENAEEKWNCPEKKVGPLIF